MDLTNTQIIKKILLRENLSLGYDLYTSRTRNYLVRMMMSSLRANKSDETEIKIIVVNYGSITPPRQHANTASSRKVFVLVLQTFQTFEGILLQFSPSEKPKVTRDNNVDHTFFISHLS